VLDADVPLFCAVWFHASFETGAVIMDEEVRWIEAEEFHRSPKQNLRARPKKIIIF
jgi:hypothetical protein